MGGKCSFYLQLPIKSRFLIDLNNKKQVVFDTTRERLEEHLWNYDYVGSSNVIDVYIRYLRKKIDEGAQTKLIHTVRGAGYVMRAEP